MVLLKQLNILFSHFPTKPLKHKTLTCDVTFRCQLVATVIFILSDMLLLAENAKDHFTKLFL